MNNKGFTLVELIAVIVILSLLAVLASTSVTKVVRDSKSDLYNTQLELIKSAAEAWGADNLNKLPEDGACKYLTLETLKEYGLIESDIKNPKTNKPFSDQLKIKISSNVTSYGTSKLEYEVDSKSISRCENAYPPICKLVSGEAKEIGSKYSCEVKPGTKYYFYVLSKEENKINLIMERNICDNGELATAENTCLVAWISSSYGGTTAKGPVTAMTHIHNATNDWINIPNMIMDYEDENILYSSQEKGTSGYGSIKTINNITTITDKEGNVTATYENLKARLPKYSEVKVNGCRTTSGSCPLWLVDYLHEYSAYTEGKTNITGIYGYWTLSSDAGGSYNAWIADYYSSVDNFTVSNGSNYGSRPVITVLESSVSE